MLKTYDAFSGAMNNYMNGVLGRATSAVNTNTEINNMKSEVASANRLNSAKAILNMSQIGPKYAAKITDDMARNADR